MSCLRDTIHWNNPKDFLQKVIQEVKTNNDLNHDLASSAYEKDSIQNNQEEDENNYTNSVLKTISDCFPDGYLFFTYEELKPYMKEGFKQRMRL